jgi:hypothetical protein
MDESLRVCCLLKIYHVMLNVVVNFPQKSDDSIFQEILLLCEIIDGARITYTTDPRIIDFSSELGIIAPLFFTVVVRIGGGLFFLFGSVSRGVTLETLSPFIFS